MDSNLALYHRGRVSLILKVVLIPGSSGDIRFLSFCRAVSSELAEVSFTSNRWNIRGQSLSIQIGLQLSMGAIIGALGNLISQGHYSSALTLGPIGTWLVFEPG